MASPEFLERLRHALKDRYLVEREIGRGGMATVYVAQDLKHSRPVALKVLRPEVSAAVGAERFLQEIQIAARLNHPHILPLHDSGEAAGFLYFVMPYVAGESLRQLLNREEQLPVDEALHIAREVADALDYAHRQNVVHRDIKPENILLVEGHALVADFGIARAIRVAAGRERATETGIAVGTPEYMSPEQAGGRQEPDGRSDIYSLGCVLYEMLAGDPPFTDPSAATLVARHLADPAPALHARRPTVPVDVERAIDVALAKAPADRYQTAAAFAEALPVISGGRAAATPRSLRAQRAAILIAAGGLLAAALFVAPRLLGGPPLDVSRYVVLPFEHRDSVAPVLLNGDQCEWHLSTALRSYRDIQVVDYFLVEDAWKRLGSDATAGAEFDLAERFGAGRLLRGELAGFGDSVVVRATLFDVRGGDVIRQAEVTVRPEREDVARRFEQLAVDLLGLRPPSEPPGRTATRVFAAGRAYVAGRNAVTEGDFAQAARSFQTAVQLDPEFGEAHFWLAQVLAWSGRPVGEWRVSAIRAAELSHQLARPSDSALTGPLRHLAELRFPEACREYRRLLARDSTDFAAWLGLGQCEARDTVVVRASGSPSQWAFRGSHQQAVRAYRRALELTPFLTPAFYSQLVRLVKTEPSQFRFGVAAPPDTGTFWAYPSLDGDTLAFVPYRELQVRLGAPATRSETNAAALARNRELLRDVVAQWAAAYPASAEAQLRLAQTLEMFGQLTAPGGQPSAQAALARAREMARDRREARYAALMEVRVALKLRDFARAKALADSLLESRSDLDTTDLHAMAALAALTGRASLAADLNARGGLMLRQTARDVRLRTLPVSLFEVRERVRAFAALGGPRDSLVAWHDEFERQLGGLVSSGMRVAVRQQLMDDVMAWAYPILGRSSVHRPGAPNYLLSLQWQAAQRTPAAVRARLDTLQAIRRSIAPGDVAVSFVYQEVLLRLAIGDTAAAREQLDRSLAALPSFSWRVVDDLPDPAALVRALALRARLAGGGPPADLRSWAEPVTVLWKDADPGLRGLVDSMAALMERSRP